VKIGIGGGLGPFRAGVSTRGFGVGVGPVHASSGWGGRRGGSSGGCGTLLVVLLVVGAVYLVVAWPYLLGTWLAVQFGAGLHSTARGVTGWVFEGVAVLVTLAVVVMGVIGARIQRQQEEKQARWQAAHDRRELLAAQLDELDAVLERLSATPSGELDPRVKPKERLLAEFPGSELMEPRSAYRGGPKVPTPVDTGTVFVTDLTVRIQGSNKNVEWRYDRMLDRRFVDGAVIFAVSNRQLISGVRAPLSGEPALQTAVEWAAALFAGADRAAVSASARATRSRLSDALRTAQDELAAETSAVGPALAPGS
jgi:hypothetical protein